MPARFARTALDGGLARLAALLLALAVAGLALWVHRNQFFPKPPAEAAKTGPDPFTQCLSVRNGDVDRMLAEKSIDAGVADLFRARAEAMCRAEADKAAGRTPGLPPGMTPTPKF
jgi:hypothetical protein